GRGTFTTYPIHDSFRGTNIITLMSPKDITHFKIGNFVYWTGGEKVNGTLVLVSNISYIVSINSAGGTFTVAYEQINHLPFRTRTVSPYVEKLSTNNAILTNLTWRDITFSTPNTPFVSNLIYNLQFLNVESNATGSEASGNDSFIESSWATKVVFNN